jgi:hypothetical protein
MISLSSAFYEISYDLLKKLKIKNGIKHDELNRNLRDANNEYNKKNDQTNKLLRYKKDIPDFDPAKHAPELFKDKLVNNIDHQRIARLNFKLNTPMLNKNIEGYSSLAHENQKLKDYKNEKRELLKK